MAGKFDPAAIAAKMASSANDSPDDRAITARGIDVTPSSAVSSAVGLKTQPAAAPIASVVEVKDAVVARRKPKPSQPPQAITIEFPADTYEFMREKAFRSRTTIRAIILQALAKDGVPVNPNEVFKKRGAKAGSN